MNLPFKEASSLQQEPITKQCATSPDEFQKTVTLFELEDDTVLNLQLLHVTACPPGELARMPGKAQTLETRQIVLLDAEKQAYFYSRPNEKTTKLELRAPIVTVRCGRDAGKKKDTAVFPVWAELFCEGRSLKLTLHGELDKEYHWAIILKSAVYYGNYSY